MFYKCSTWNICSAHGRAARPRRDSLPGAATAFLTPLRLDPRAYRSSNLAQKKAGSRIKPGTTVKAYPRAYRATPPYPVPLAQGPEAKTTRKIISNHRKEKTRGVTPSRSPSFSVADPRTVVFCRKVDISLARVASEFLQLASN
jgi:hypothetical protein